ncbi:hypothetical protein JD844_023952 [Phrynosoma platyrhinos]|uniref:Uncharacterized protein n=1 Tax=Phrynosoma platyrhinos TaxID=52577 RepID=A0ABQ7SXJ1_PHRPL|nr:hypothetical protein JD844_023952 [Phrynosoma platyrhinos]
MKLAAASHLSPLQSVNGHSRLQAFGSFLLRRGGTWNCADRVLHSSCTMWDIFKYTSRFWEVFQGLSSLYHFRYHSRLLFGSIKLVCDLLVIPRIIFPVMPPHVIKENI